MLQQCLRKVARFRNVDSLLRRQFSFSAVRNNSMFEPDYLVTYKPEFPSYDALTFQLKGYDYPVLESFQSYMHNVAECLDVEVENGWAFPPQHLRVKRYKPQSTNVDAEYKVLVYERNLKMVNVPAIRLSVLLEIFQTALPQGVKLRIFNWTQDQEISRYVPNVELRLLQDELEELGGPPEEPKPEE